MSSFKKHFSSTWKSQFSLQLSTLLVTSASFTLLACALLIGLHFSRILNLWGNQYEMTVYLIEGTTSDEVQHVRKQIERFSDVDKVEFVDKKQTLAVFSKQFSALASQVNLDQEVASAIPESFQVFIKESVENPVEIMGVLSKELKSYPEVSEVNYGHEWVERYSYFVKILKSIGTVLAGILVSATLFVIMNSVRASVDARRNEIEVLELVGASRGMISFPFILEGGILGFMSSSLALVFSYFVFEFIHQSFSQAILFGSFVSSLEFFTWYQIFGFIVVGFTLGMFSAWLCIRKVNTYWAAAQRSESFGV